MGGGSRPGLSQSSPGEKHETGRAGPQPELAAPQRRVSRLVPQPGLAPAPRAPPRLGLAPSGSSSVCPSRSSLPLTDTPPKVLGLLSWGGPEDPPRIFGGPPAPGRGELLEEGARALSLPPLDHDPAARLCGCRAPGARGGASGRRTRAERKPGRASALVCAFMDCALPVQCGGGALVNTALHTESPGGSLKPRPL